MKATINKASTKPKRLVLEIGHWYWITDLSGSTRLYVFVSADPDTYALIDIEQGFQWIEPAASIEVLQNDVMRLGVKVTPAKVTINAE
jgi:hypothetical protein